MPVRVLCLPAAAFSGVSNGVAAAAAAFCFRYSTATCLLTTFDGSAMGAALGPFFLEAAPAKNTT